MSRYGPFPVRSTTAAQLGYASAAEHPFGPITDFSDTGFVQALLDGVVSNDAAGSMTYQYWQLQINTGGQGEIVQATGLRAGGETPPASVAQWFADYAAIPYLPKNIGAATVQSTAAPAPGATVPPPNFADIQRIQRLIDSGTLGPWIPPGGGMALPADPGVSAYPGLALGDVIVLLETMANNAWAKFVAAYPNALGVLPNAPYPALYSTLGSNAVQLSNGTVVGGLSALDNGPQDYSAAVTVNPATGIGTVAAGTYRPVTDVTTLPSSALTTTAQETQPPTPTEASAAQAAPTPVLYQGAGGGNGSSVGTVSTPTLSAQIATPTPASATPAGGFNWQTAGIVAAIVAALAVAWAVWGKK